ncbi:MAG: bifunctional hydroxymethylpyrimidine kinase/phosphomethylpyrimidine kinase [Candidatus Desulfofervidaceae bacterium]|nr:bifunctional hydroxymethylpyrimidine kinase/phosphomethylpyrimidine kinase [Candidatus Desulfofervidaceae bacterium]
MANILIIAGFDPTGGAGLQADLKTVTLLGEVGLTVATALTVQNTQGVQVSEAVNGEILKQQLESLYADCKIDAVKIGMLPDEETIGIVTYQLKKCPPAFLVVDPVLKAKNDFFLNKGFRTLINTLFPLASLITPNLDEVEAILRMRPQNIAEMKEAARELKALGPKAVLVTGGDLSNATDVLFDGRDFYIWETTKKQSKPVHGTGCVFSSAITAFLVKGYPLPEAVMRAQKVITLAVDAALQLGKGSLLSHPYAYIEQHLAYFEVLEALKKGLSILQKERWVTRLVPEVRSNLVYALPYARNHAEVAGFPGRLTVVEERLISCASPAFGVSHHMASVVLKAMEFNRDYRAAMNIKYRPEIVEKAKTLGYKIKEVSRASESAETKEIEGMSLPWLTETALESSSNIPDLIYDKGDLGKEPMIRVLGRTPQEVTHKVVTLAKEVFK